MLANYSGVSSWQPIFDVNASEYTATLLLIRSTGIVHPGRRDDPIFPAAKTYDGTSYINEVWHGGVLACLDRTTICNPDGTTCESLNCWAELELKDYNEDFFVLSMLYTSLFSSNMNSAINFRKAEALDAKSKFLGVQSLPLAKEQWKVEVKQLFATSLARIQISARNNARGNPYGDILGQVDMMRPVLRPMCDMYKFKSTGWRNINVTGFVCATVAGLVVFILGFTTKEDKLWIERVIAWIGGLRLFYLCRTLRYFATWISSIKQLTPLPTTNYQLSWNSFDFLGMLTDGL